MAHAIRLATAALALTAALAATAHAQTSVESGLAFYRPAKVGAVEVTPFNLVSDTRCADPDLCLTNDSVVISVFMDSDRGPQAMNLRLGQPRRVPGGFLMLTNTGVAPSANGAISIENYRIELVFIPDRSGPEGS